MQSLPLLYVASCDNFGSGSGWDISHPEVRSSDSKPTSGSRATAGTARHIVNGDGAFRREDSPKSPRTDAGDVEAAADLVGWK